MKTIPVPDDKRLAEIINAIINEEHTQEEAEREQEQLASTKKIVDAVKRDGDNAIREFTLRFDGIDLAPEQFEIPENAIKEAREQVPRHLVHALEHAHENIRRFHEKNMVQSWEETSADGTILGQRVSAIASAGVYVPGGTAFYPSSVLMNIVPAKVAGVEEIIMVSPPSYQGSLHPLVLTAAHIAGATRVFRIGGAHAVAALAYGTATIPRVDKITGPGNIYVTLAKRIVSTVCDIDKEAGPSEIVVIADETAEPQLAAIELLCQAEHDEEALAVLITLSEEKAQAISRALEALLPELSRADIIRHALDRNGRIYIVRNLDDAAALTNTIAPEHLSLQVQNPTELFGKIRNAGAVMLGQGTPVAVGDYYAGPNHILPTGRRARYASALTVEDFRKVTNYISYSQERLQKAANDIICLAEEEGLTAHAKAVELRR